MIERLKINHFYSTPAVLSELMNTGDSDVKKYDMSSLKNLGLGKICIIVIIDLTLALLTCAHFTAGLPTKPKVWKWYHSVVGGERCPILDTWEQTGKCIQCTIHHSWGENKGPVNTQWYSMNITNIH